MTTRRHGRSPGTLCIIISTEVGGVASKIAPAFSRISRLATAASRPVTCNFPKDPIDNDV
jgi:hypothetical protein